MDYIKEVKTFVEKECQKPSSKYGYEIFPYHFTPVVNYAKKLQEKMGGDREVIILAAWLHDIGSVIYGRENHHETSAKIAEEKLVELDYPKEKIERVKQCILNHRGSINSKRETIEEKIIAEADVMSAFDFIGGIFRAAIVYEDLDQKTAQQAVLKKLENKWKQLHFPESKKLIEPKYKAAKILFG